jgi:hypothetical protein
MLDLGKMQAEQTILVQKNIELSKIGIEAKAIIIEAE